MTQTPERIICPAVWINIPNDVVEIDRFDLPANLANGIVLCGYRHISCMAVSSLLKIDVAKYPKVDGYLTTHNRFVDRKEAAKIHNKPTSIPGFLYSNDLY